MSKEKIITDRGYWECENPDIYKFDKGLARGIAQHLSSKNKKTALDLGCGNGEYTKYLNEHGVECYGCDGNPYTPNISDNCGVCDLTKPVTLEPVQWVVCLEVAEHIPKEYEGELMNNIHNLNTEGVIISWAIPGQGGHGHVNEQDNDYVRKLFRGYKENFENEKELRDNAVFPWFKNTLMVFER